MKLWEVLVIGNFLPLGLNKTKTEQEILVSYISQDSAKI